TGVPEHRGSHLQAKGRDFLSAESATESGTDRVRLGPGVDQYQIVSRAYDVVAGYYDEIEGRNEISERVRRASMRTALRVFRAGDRILEIGCGTGRDAMELAQHSI